MTLEELLDRLREFDLLLDTDPKFPSVTSAVIGESIRGTWWTHPQAREVFRLSCALRDHPDVLTMRLISGKITFVHRPLWPAIYAIATAREPWQIDKLSREAKALLQKADRAGELESSGDPTRELEKYMLVHSRSVHTERGTHVKHVMTWQAWAKSVGLCKVKIKPAEAKGQLESVIARLNTQSGAAATLPWKKIGVHRRASAAKI